MKLEFLDVTSGGEHPTASPQNLIRISSFSKEEQSKLIESIEIFLQSPENNLALHQLPFVKSNNCSVTLRHSTEDGCLVKTGSYHDYSCFLTVPAYQEMIGIIKNVDGGHNWLTPGEYLDEPAFLISMYGPW
ncbi:MAG: hypothetical protein K2P88_12310 [Chitinophagaceae bacterium]|nr:hypothetical protein [Chitinophagaceae bacterium]